MRASTLFAITLAVLLGLAAAVTVKVTGFFSRPTADVAPAKIPEINVLVAARNLYAGDLIDNGWVTVRPLRADEFKDYEANKEKYLPPVPNAAVLRITAKNIETDKPLLRESLVDLDKTKPESLSTRLLPNMRAVSLVVAKEHCAGGLIQKDEWVDVFFTTQINVNGVNSTRSAPIAHKQRVLAKRDSLWPIFAGLPEDKPVRYILEMNPYRAALMEYCKTKGTLSIMPVSSAEQKTLEQNRVAALEDKNFQLVSFAPPKMEASPEYEDEDERVDAINKGSLNIGTRDLARIFNMQSKAPPLARPEEPKPITVQQLSGNRRVGNAQFNTDGTLYEKASGPGVRNTEWDELYYSQHPVAAPKPLPAHHQGARLQSSSSTYNGFTYETNSSGVSGVDFTTPDASFSAPASPADCKSCKKNKSTTTIP